MKERQSEFKTSVIQQDEISLMEIYNKVRDFIHYCLSHRLLFLKVWALAIPLSIFYALGTTPEYTVTTKLLHQNSDQNRQRGLAGLAGLAGINLSLNQSPELINASLYPEVAKSYMFLERLASAPLLFEQGEMNYITYMDSVYRPSIFTVTMNYTIKLPLTLLGRIRSQFKKDSPNNAMQIKENNNEVLFVPREHLNKVRSLKRRINIDVNDKSKMIVITATLSDPIGAAHLARATSKQLTQLVTEYESNKASEQAKYLETQQLEAEKRLRGAQTNLAQFLDQNKSIVSATAQIETQWLQSEVEVASELYRSFTTQLEAARVKQKEDTPLFTVVEAPMIPHAPTSPRRMRLIVSVFLISTVLTISYLFAGKVISMIKIS